MDLSVHQLMAMRSLRSQGWPGSMVEILLRRCGLERASWAQLLDQGLVLTDKQGKLWLTKAGKSLYNRLKKTKYF